MWSYVQYRQIGRKVEEEAKHNSNTKAGDGAVLEKEPSELERGRTDSSDNQPSKPRSSSAGKNADDDGDDDSDHITVRCHGDDDPMDPKNWSLLSRCKNIAILCFLIFGQAWSGAAESMANTEASKEFNVSKVAETLSTAMYLFGVGTGSLFAGPLSESIGRNPTYLVGTFCYLLFVLGAALVPTFAGQVICRYFIGLFASATLAINGASVQDQFRSVKRTFVFPVIAWANVTAPVLAPIAGGWIVSNLSLGWRWTEWITLIISSAGFLVAFFFLPETYLPILLRWKAKHLRRVTGDKRYISEHEKSSNFIKRVKTILPLPAKFLATEPVVTILGSYLVLLYILLFTFLSGFEFLFKQTYNLSQGYTGSCFAAIAAGTTTFALGAPGLYSWARRKTEHVRGRKLTPEFRLWPAIVAAPFLPISLFWLGWADYSNISIWCNLTACYVFGIVLIAIYVSSYEYIVDSYGDHAAIALASITMCRYLIAGGMVIAARPMYEGIGVHWTLTFLGTIAAILTPAPFAFWWYGAKLRERSPYAEGTKS